MTSDLPSSTADPSSETAFLKASLSPSSSSSSSSTPSSAPPSCLFHSRKWRPTIEFCLNSLRTQGALKKSNLFLKALTCTCTRSSSSSSSFSSLPSSFNPASAIAALDPEFDPLKSPLNKLLQGNQESEQARNLVFLVHSLANELPPSSLASLNLSSEEDQPRNQVSLPLLLSKTVQIPLEESFIGVFITKKGFASLLAPLKQRIHLHCGTWAAGSLPITISAVSMEIIDTAAQALKTQALITTLARKRHQESLRQWAEERRQQRQLRRESQALMISEQSSLHRGGESARNVAIIPNLKQVATHQYVRSVKAAKAAKGLGARQKRQLSREERKQAHELSREQGLVCSLCSQGFKEAIASSPCSYHPGFVRDRSHWGRGKASRRDGHWSCCGQGGEESQPCTEGKHVWVSRGSSKEDRRRQKERVHRRTDVKASPF